MHTIKFDPDAMGGEVLFQHRDTKQLKWVRADREEVLIHELYHPWFDGGDAQLVTIGKPQKMERSLYERDPKSLVIAEGYTIRYLNTIRKANGGRWMRLIHDERSNYPSGAHGGGRVYLRLDGPQQGELIRK